MSAGIWARPPLPRRAPRPQCVIQCGGRARFFGDLDEGIDSFEAPEIGYDVDRSYDNLYTGNRVKLATMPMAESHAGTRASSPARRRYTK